MTILTNESSNFVEYLTFDNRYFLAIVVIVVAIIISFTLQKLVYNTVIFFSTHKNRSETNKLLKSSCNLIASILKYFVYVVALFVILAIFQVQITVVLTSAGFIGLFFAYLLQDIIRDVTNGFFIVFKRPFEIGDRVTIDGFTGKVKEINSRVVVLVDASGNKAIISNRKIDSIIVLTRNIEFQ
jgi:small conductance mechanosensitive channel